MVALGSQLVKHLEGYASEKTTYILPGSGEALHTFFVAIFCFFSAHGWVGLP
jgi:hypothetical protein